MNVRWETGSSQNTVFIILFYFFEGGGTSLVVQGLRLQTPNAGGVGLIPGPGTRSHILQLRVILP